MKRDWHIRYGRILSLVILHTIFTSFFTIDMYSMSTLMAKINKSEPGDTCEGVDCEAGFYQTTDADGKFVRNAYDGTSLSFTQISVFGFKVNGTGYNIKDNFLYTVTRPGNRLIRFTFDGSYTDLGEIDINGAATGGFDNDGNYYLTGVGNDVISKVDVTTLAVERLTIASNEKFGAADWAYIECEEKFYGVGNDGKLYSFDPATLVVTANDLTGDLSPSGGYGGAFTDVNGALYVSNNASGNIFDIDIQTNVSTLLLTGPSSSTNDGASCPCSVPPFPTLSPQDDEICITGDDSIEILINDTHSFADIDNSSFAIVEEPNNGSISYNEQSGSVLYQSDNPSQADSLVYRICLDLDRELCEEATVHFLPSFNSVVQESICEGEEIVIDGSIFSETGTFDLTLMANNGCDSIITLILEVDESSDQIFTEEICAGEEITFNGIVYTETELVEFSLLSEKGCDSTVVFDLTVHPAFEETIEQSICEGEEYLFDGQVYDVTGMYTVSYLTFNGCDSIYTIDLKVNEMAETNIEASLCSGEIFELNGISYSESGVFMQDLSTVNGCDSVLTISIQVSDRIETNIDREICEGESFIFGPNTLTSSGMYEQNLLTANNCDSIIFLDLTVTPNIENRIAVSICEGTSFELGGEIYTESGEYTAEFTAANGCDSILTVELSITPNFSIELSESICEGESFSFRGVEYSETEEIELFIEGQNGCDSTIALDLVVHPNFELVEQAQICASETFDFAGQTFSTTGIHEVRLQTINGCDSLLILDLVVNDNQTTNISETICIGSSFAFDGDELTEEGEYTQNLLTTSGCDSTVMLTLSIADRFETNLSESICEGEEVEIGTQVFSETGFYEVLLLASNGCDSLVSLDLVQAVSSDVSLETSICAGETYAFGNEELNEEGQYSQALMNVDGCDSIINLDLTILEVFEFEFDQEICEGEIYEIGTSSYSDPGTYFDTFTTADGCDSTIVTHLLVRAHTMSMQERFTCIEEEVGQEILTLSNSFGCDSTIVINTILSPASECSVIVALAGSTIPCMETLGLLNVEILEGTAPFTINWTGAQDGSIIQPELGSFIIGDLPPGSYSIEVIDDNGNITNSNAEILVLEEPDVIAVAPLNASGFNIDCFGGTTGAASVNGIGGTAPYTYLWSTGETSEEIQNLSAGIYSVTLTDANNCIDTTLVELNEPSTLVLDPDPIDLTCDDDQSGLVTISSSGGVPPYLYSLNDSDTQSENIFLDLAQGEYSSLVIDANGCTIEGEFALNMPTAVEVNLGEDISVDLGDPVSIQAALNLDIEDINEIIWSTNLDTDCEDCLVQTFFPSESDTFTIFVLDENGCENTDQIVINVDNDQTIYIPNAFSPNGDGINDVFTLYSDSRFSPIISELRIYDRWGNEVFANSDFPPNTEAFGWKGDFRGEAHNPGVFVYLATVEFIDGSTAFFEGDVTLMK